MLVAKVAPSTTSCFAFGCRPPVGNRAPGGGTRPRRTNSMSSGNSTAWPSGWWLQGRQASLLLHDAAGHADGHLDAAGGAQRLQLVKLLWRRVEDIAAVQQRDARGADGLGARAQAMACRTALSRRRRG